MPFLRQSHNVKPVCWGSDADVQYAVAKNSEKIYGINSDNLVLAMPRWEMTGNVVRDYSRYVNNGTNYGAIWDLQGMNFLGASDYVKMAKSFFSSYPFSIVMQASPSSAGECGGISSADSSSDYGSFALQINANVIRGFIYTQAAGFIATIGATTIPTGTWANIAFVVASGTDKRVYLNGKYDGISTTPVVFPANQNSFNIGRLGRLTVVDYDGGVDSPILVNLVLSAEQIALFYARKWDLYRRVGRTYYSIAAVPSIYIPQIMIF